MVGSKCGFEFHLMMGTIRLPQRVKLHPMICSGKGDTDHADKSKTSETVLRTRLDEEAIDLES